jgi:hypothetical protein
MNEIVPFMLTWRDPRNAGLSAGLRDLYALALHDPLPQEWHSLAERFEAAQIRPVPRRPVE